MTRKEILIFVAMGCFALSSGCELMADTQRMWLHAFNVLGIAFNVHMLLND